MVYHHVHPLWYKLYSTATNVAWLTVFTIAHTVEFTKAIRNTREIAVANEPSGILWFEEAASTSEAAAEGDELDDDIVTSDASLAKNSEHSAH